MDGKSRYLICRKLKSKTSEEEKIRAVKWSDEFGCWIRTKTLDDAECVVLDSVRYNILNIRNVDDAPTKVIVLNSDEDAEHYQTVKKVAVTSRDLADIAWGLQKMAEEIVAALESQQDA